MCTDCESEQGQKSAPGTGMETALQPTERTILQQIATL